MKRILHLITQDDQPIGSCRKCCEICGKAQFTMDGNTVGWTDSREEYADPKRYFGEGTLTCREEKHA